MLSTVTKKNTWYGSCKDSNCSRELRGYVLSEFVTLQRETPSPSFRRVCMNSQTQPDHLSQSVHQGKPPNFPIQSQGVGPGQIPLPSDIDSRVPRPLLGMFRRQGPAWAQLHILLLFLLLLLVCICSPAHHSLATCLLCTPLIPLPGITWAPSGGCKGTTRWGRDGGTREWETVHKDGRLSVALWMLTCCCSSVIYKRKFAFKVEIMLQ